MKPYNTSDVSALLAEERANAVRVAREELTRLEAEMWRAVDAHERLVDSWKEAPADRRKQLYRRPIEDARFREGKAAGAFEGARRLAERLGLIGEGERDFYRGAVKP